MPQFRDDFIEVLQMKMKVVMTMERSLKMGNNYHLNQTQMKVKMSAKGTYAKSTSVLLYMYVT